MKNDCVPGNHVEMIKVDIPGDQIIDQFADNAFEEIDEAHLRYVSKFEAVKNDRLMLSMPMRRSKYAPIKRGEIYHVFIFCNYKVVHCDAVIEGALQEGKHITLVTKMISELKKLERRAYYRIPCDTNILYKVVPERDFDHVRFNYKNGHTGKVDDDFSIGQCIDISAGGMKFTSRFGLTQDQTIGMSFSLQTNNGKEAQYYLLAHVIESSHFGQEDRRYVNRVAFEIYNAKVREDLVSYVFFRQRSVMKRS